MHAITTISSNAGVREARLTWDEFLEEVLPEARSLVSDASDSGVETYLGALAAVACRLDPRDVARPRFSPFPGFPEDVGFALSYRGSPFLGVQFWIEPGALLPFHPHPGGSVCTLFLEGAARVRNFEFAEKPDWNTKGQVLLRETQEELLLPGRVNLIGNPRNNIHGFRAGPKGARGIDFTTSNRPDLSREDSLFEISAEPRDPELGIYEAVWRDK